MPSSHQVMRSVVVQSDPQLGRLVARALREHRFACHLVEKAAADFDLEPFRNCQLVVVDLDAVDAFYARFVSRIRSELPAARLLLLSVNAKRYPQVEAAGVPLDSCVIDPDDALELRDKLALAIELAKSRETAALVPDPPPAAEKPPNGGPPAADGAGAAQSLRVRGRAALERGASGLPDFAEAPAYVIVLGGAKGGTGKTTLALNLIAALLREDLTVASIDLRGGPASLDHALENRQKHAAASGTPPTLPKHASIPPGEGELIRFETALLALRETSDILVIDTPAAESPLSRAAHSWADSLITPINDSFLDLAMLARIGENGNDALPGDYFELVYQANLDKLRREVRPIDWIVVPNRVPSLPSNNSREVAQQLSRLAGALGFQIGPALGERVIYREHFNAGLAIADLGDVRRVQARPASHQAALRELAALRAMIGASRPTSVAAPTSAGHDATRQAG